ncbi:hypothetical protein EYF80_062393 [Liparis tanakae]|uniref:Uncharacterized protein n=1 Tax=Liparis tanakae TaxID=230148 RepID=A0A4Z2EGK9_9TELE|nr:hypothetical protein EYF80_062393 [Liparis tanakae]
MRTDYNTTLLLRVTMHVHPSHHTSPPGTPLSSQL